MFVNGVDECTIITTTLKIKAEFGSWGAVYRGAFCAHHEVV